MLKHFTTKAFCSIFLLHMQAKLVLIGLHMLYICIHVSNFSVIAYTEISLTVNL